VDDVIPDLLTVVELRRCRQCLERDGTCREILRLDFWMVDQMVSELPANVNADGRIVTDCDEKGSMPMVVSMSNLVCVSGDSIFELIVRCKTMKYHGKMEYLRFCKSCGE
jgi:hypothetical protein